MRPLFTRGTFILHSGERADWRINCESLTDEDYAALALIASRLLPPFGRVEPVPRGGFKFAAALRQYATEGPLLIAEDVVTTGASMEAIRAGREAIGIAVFSRGIAPDWVRAIWRIDSSLAGIP